LSGSGTAAVLAIRGDFSSYYEYESKLHCPQNLGGVIINNNNNQYIYKQRQSHAMSQRRWLATAVIFRPSDVSLGFAET